MPTSTSRRPSLRQVRGERGLFNDLDDMLRLVLLAFRANVGGCGVVTKIPPLTNLVPWVHATKELRFFFKRVSPV